MNTKTASGKGYKSIEGVQKKTTEMKLFKSKAFQCRGGGGSLAGTAVRGEGAFSLNALAVYR